MKLLIVIFCDVMLVEMPNMNNLIVYHCYAQGLKVSVVFVGKIGLLQGNETLAIFHDVLDFTFKF